MKVNQQHYRTIWPDIHHQYVEIIDQTVLPFKFEIVRVENFTQMLTAINTMQVRGAPLIGVAAAYAIALAMNADSSDDALMNCSQALIKSRPTAVNLAWAVRRMQETLTINHKNDRKILAWSEAAKIADEDVEQNIAIGQHGLPLIEKYAHKKTVNILTHCNAGWLATVDYGTALAPIYSAHDAGIGVHVWVDETRPRNQGANLTAWELQQHGVPHTIIVDNAGGHLMQKGEVDMVLVGADRIAKNGDVCNKIGTYLKALAAYDNQIPFYVAAPSNTFDKQILNGKSIEIENRDPKEIVFASGMTEDNHFCRIKVMNSNHPVINPAFDVTPERFITSIINEQGVLKLSE